MNQDKPIFLTVDRIAERVALLTIDVPGEKQNTLKPEFEEQFDTVWTKIEGSDVTAVVIVSGKDDSFIAGADIEMIRAMQSAEDAERRSRGGQAAFLRIERSKVPVVAAIHGACLGGGLELALACHARIASDDQATKLGLPEVQLGLLPGAGGTQRLPRTVGVEQALDLMLTGKQISSRRAKKIGLVDDVVPRSILVQAAVAKATALAETDRKPAFIKDLADPKALRELAVSGNVAGRMLVFDQAEKSVRKTAGDHYPAPYRILEAVRVGLEKGVEAGYEAESKKFGELAITDVARRLIDVFFATTELKKDHGTTKKNVRPRPLNRIGVLGAGIMGHGIGYVTAAQAGLPVRLRDIDERSIGRGLANIRSIADARVSKKRLTPAERDRLMNQISGTTDLSGFSRCDLIVEAVFEDLDLKHRVLQQVEAVCKDDAVFGSNTSSIPIARIAEGSARPERVVGMHYFSPVHKMPLLEVIRTQKTDDVAIATAVDLGRRQNKTVIVVNDGVGFYTTRVLAPYMNEAAWLLSEGVPVETIDEAARMFGFPVGPITLLDEVGIDTADKIARIMHAEFGDRMRPPPGLDALVRDGRTGRKGGRGFYTYDAKKKVVDRSVYDVLGVDRRVRRKHHDLDEVAARLSLAMVTESIRCLSDGILRSPRDGDVGAIFGLGFPPFTGGPFHYADHVGAAVLNRRIRSLADRFGARFAPPQMLTDRARSGHRFYQ